MSTTHEGGNQQSGERSPHTPPARPSADYRPRVLSFLGGEVDARAFVADHLNGVTPTTLIADESGIIFDLEECK